MGPQLALFVYKFAVVICLQCICIDSVKKLQLSKEKNIKIEETAGESFDAHAFLMDLGKNVPPPLLEYSALSCVTGLWTLVVSPARRPFHDAYPVEVRSAMAHVKPQIYTQQVKKHRDFMNNRMHQPKRAKIRFLERKIKNLWSQKVHPIPFAVSAEDWIISKETINNRVVIATVVFKCSPQYSVPVPITRKKSGAE